MDQSFLSTSAGWSLFLKNRKSERLFHSHSHSHFLFFTVHNFTPLLLYRITIHFPLPLLLLHISVFCRDAAHLPTSGVPIDAPALPDSISLIASSLLKVMRMILWGLMMTKLTCQDLVKMEILVASMMNLMT
ncbi:hypothetical protein AAHA92_31003 [Salvia divinorum]|uniref:Uncharacterized protein n=1 Tax=Salvia divinorum TaxID=28513 RepID=A0ABD1FSQ7_SALDI